MTPMSLESAFDDMCVRLKGSHQYFQEVRLIVTDAEEGDDTKAMIGDLAQQMGDLIDDLEHARRYAERARRAARQRPPSIEEVGRCLARVQHLFWRASRRYGDEIVSHFKVEQMRDLARRNPRFGPWCDLVLNGLEGGRPSMHGATLALHTCWSEAFDRAVSGGVAVYAVQAANRDGGSTA